MLRVGLLHATPSAVKPNDSHSGGAVVQLPHDVAAADAVVRAIEERCAAATGVPAHEDESTLMMRHTPPSASGRMVDSLHLDTNNAKRHRCATVIIYLNDVPEGQGGETRFPLADAEDDSPLVAAATTAASSGFTAMRSDVDGAPREWGWLQDASEDPSRGVHVRPRRGAACVFWTMYEDSSIVDPRTWHNGARVAAGGGGKWIVQKFKELPAVRRKKKVGFE
jgi:hypothetical protein